MQRGKEKEEKKKYLEKMMHLSDMTDLQIFRNL